MSATTSGSAPRPPVDLRRLLNLLRRARRAALALQREEDREQQAQQQPATATNAR